jgi:hypothetical protein
MVRVVIEDVTESADRALEQSAADLPPEFPDAIPVSVQRAVTERLRLLTAES